MITVFFLLSVYPLVAVACVKKMKGLQPLFSDATASYSLSEAPCVWCKAW